MKKLIISIFVLLIMATLVYADVTDDESYSVETIRYDDDKSANSKEYFGFALPGSGAGASVWQIMRISYTGTDFILETADGDNNYNNEWDERISSVSYK